MTSSVYRYPRYYAIGYQWNTANECNFLEACLVRAGLPTSARVLDIGCGAGRHLLELAQRGHRGTGFDLHPEMVEYVQAESRKAKLPVSASVGDMRSLRLKGKFDLAICLMDTFRFLLTNDQIIRHFKQVAKHLVPGGVYVTDFWVPLKWDQIANEVYQWEQTKGNTTVRVFYVQHPDSVDPVTQTFEDELVLVVDEAGQSKEIRGERTRTRLILPQEYRALVDASGAFETIGTFSEFDHDTPFDPTSGSWRMISVLKCRA